MFLSVPEQDTLRICTFSWKSRFFSSLRIPFYLLTIHSSLPNVFFLNQDTMHRTKIGRLPGREFSSIGTKLITCWAPLMGKIRSSEKYIVYKIGCGTVVSIWICPGVLFGDVRNFSYSLICTCIADGDGLLRIRCMEPRLHLFKSRIIRQKQAKVLPYEIKTTAIYRSMISIEIQKGRSL